MNDLREKIAVMLSMYFSDRTLSECENATDRILSLLPKDEWQDAATPPNNDRDVLTLHANGKRLVNNYRRAGTGHEWSWSLNITHWMELPAPPKPEAKAKLPEGVVVCAMPDGCFHVRAGGWWLLKKGRWERMTLPTHEYPGEFGTYAAALAAALKAPPLPTETKSRDGCKPSPVVTHADMRRLAEVLATYPTASISDAIEGVFKEPA